MTIRNYLLATLAVLCASASTTLAATPATAAASGTAAKAPIIADKDAPRFLNPTQQDQWSRDLQQIADANAKIASGKRLVALKEDPAAAIKVDVTAQHTKGAADVKEGQAMIKLASADMDKLRVIAAAKRDAVKNGAAATDAAVLAVATAQWPDVANSMCEKLMSSLWDQGYKHIYFADMYAFEEPAYVTKPDLSEQVRQQFVKLDKGKNTFTAQHDWSFKLATDNGKLYISYPDRAYLQQGNTKAAVIVGEVLYESHDGYAAVDLRAVDLANMHIVANQIMMLSVDPSLGKQLGLAIFKAMSKRIPPTPESKGADPVTAVSVNLQDPNDLMSGAKKATYAFGVGTLGHADTLENRFAILLTKSYFRNQQSDLSLSDQDFLVKAFPAEKPGDLAAPAADVGAQWMLPNIAEFAPSMEISSLKLRIVGTSGDRDVGKLTITRDLPKLSDPSAEDLRMGGYSASP
jgi:hypothetical protein